MPHSLYYLLIAVVGIYLWLSLRRRRAAVVSGAEAGSGIRRGPIPGYAYMPGSAVQFDPSEPLQVGVSGWNPVSLETLHAGARTRLVLSLRRQGEPSDDAEVFTLLKTLARRVQQRTRAVVVAVRLEDDQGEAEAAVVLATDGRGWTGTTSDAELTAALPGREPFRFEPAA